MAESGELIKVETEVGTEDVRRGLTELMGRAVFGYERFVITRNGKPYGALIGMKDLERLRTLDAA
jgi:prevent-host-death family protein